MERRLLTCGFPFSLCDKLESSGIKYLNDLKGKTDEDLIEFAGLEKREVEIIKKFVEQENQCTWTFPSAKDLLWKENVMKIKTGCLAMDSILNGGIAVGTLTEVAGEPGSGKTTFCMQLCRNVQYESSEGGLQGEAVYLDTDRGFSLQRLNEMCSTLSEDARRNVLSGIHYQFCPTATHLIAAITLLPDFFRNHQKVRLLVIDCLAIPLRYEFSQTTERSSVQYSIAQKLLQTAHNHDIAVVVTNQMTTQIVDGEAQQVTALGNSWGHCPTHRLLLHSNRFLSVIKSPSLPPLHVQFQIGHEGIQDINDAVG